MAVQRRRTRSRLNPGGADVLKVLGSDVQPLAARKPPWFKVRAPGGQRYRELSKLIKEQGLNTVCQEAACPNIGECWDRGTATFMILGDTCTRRCGFCNVQSGKPTWDDPLEPGRVAHSISLMGLRHAVITSVDRDDLRDGGAQHFVDCIQAIRSVSATTRIEILVPDFRGRLEKALDIFAQALPDVMNHNLETVPRLYKEARPGADYLHSLKLLQNFKQRYPHIPTKSGLMVGLGETDEEILSVMRDMRAHQIDMLTIGQYLAPSAHHLPVRRYVHPSVFADFEQAAREMAFSHAAVGAMVRSSYHADQQAAGAGLAG